MSEERTIQYYDENAEQYFRETVAADMAVTCDRFLKYVRPGGTIVDIGAGSGRDLKYFKEKGYAAEGIDASEALCVRASEYAFVPVTCIRIQDWYPKKKYAGIWACASLLHLKMDEIETFICRLPDLLEEGGTAYISLKSGIETGTDEKGRYFTNVTEDDLRKITGETDGLEIAEFWNSCDQMRRQDFIWMNVILKRHLREVDEK